MRAPVSPSIVRIAAPVSSPAIDQSELLSDITAPAGPRRDAGDGVAAVRLPAGHSVLLHAAPGDGATCLEVLEGVCRLGPVTLADLVARLEIPRGAVWRVAFDAEGRAQILAQFDVRGGEADGAAAMGPMNDQTTQAVGPV